MRLLYRELDKLCVTPDTPASEPYAILSHTWGEEEVLFEDILQGKSSPKLEFALNQAEKDGYKYVWVDTCCIDRKDRTELGKAINLMWQWYEESAVCYVYLSDVPLCAFLDSRWHTRGWTLQELLAPSVVQFFDVDGCLLGDRLSLAQQLVQTGVEVSIPLKRVPLAERWRWSRRRCTTEPEDAAYCMLGLLEIQLIFNYGEGAESAEERLFEAVGKEHGKRTLREMRMSISSNPCDSVEALYNTYAFAGMALREQTIGEPFPGTCKWLQGREEYQQWLAQERDMIWIKGRPGTGKSTLMKFIRTRSSLAFFFNARGTQLEQSVPGMFRSLLCQILQNELVANEVLNFARQQDTHLLPLLSLLSLQSTLRFAIALLQPTRCFIDALDECDQREVQDMVHFFEDSGLFVCFASRHYPAIAIKSAHFEMDDADIEPYVHGRLIPNLKEEVIIKANGIFIWAVLVVRMLNEEHAKGLAPLKKLLILPSALSSLLGEIVFQKSDDQHTFKLALCLLLFAKRALPPSAFVRALEIGAGLSNIANPDRFITTVTRGLAEVITTGESDEPGEPRIQFIHETVREFLLNGALRQLHGSEVEAWAHEMWSSICNKELFTSTVETDSRSPLTSYTVNTIIYHAELAVDKERFILDLESHWERTEHLLCAHRREPNTRWQIIHLLVAEDAPGLVTAAHKVSPFIAVTLPNPLSMAIRLGAYRLCWTLLDCDIIAAMTDTEDSPLHALARFGSVEGEALMRDLLSRGLDVDFTDNYGWTPLIIAASRGNYRNCELLLQAGANMDIECDADGSALHVAVVCGRVKVVQLLLTHGAQDKVSNMLRGAPSQYRPRLWGSGKIYGNSALHDACRLGFVEIVKQLLPHGLEARNRQDETPLILACTCTKASALDVVRVLLAAGAQVNVQSNQRLTPIDLAHNLCCSIDSNDQHPGDRHGKSLVGWAIVKQLLDAGAEIDTQFCRTWCRPRWVYMLLHPDPVDI